MKGGVRGRWAQHHGGEIQTLEVAVENMDSLCGSRWKKSVCETCTSILQVAGYQLSGRTAFLYSYRLYKVGDCVFQVVFFFFFFVLADKISSRLTIKSINVNSM